MSIPGLAVGLVVLAVVDRLGLWMRGRSGLPWYHDGHRPVSAVGFEELQAAFHSGGRYAIEQRTHELVLRDDEHDGAPPRVRVDLERGVVVIARPGGPFDSSGSGD